MPINIFYYSLEINEVSKKANWLSVLIHQKYDIIISPEKIKGLGDFRLDKNELEIVNKNKLLSMLPYLATALVLALISRNPAWIQRNMPASLGRPFTPGQ
mgnify:CR=1 FL=1